MNSNGTNRNRSSTIRRSVVILDPIPEEPFKRRLDGINQRQGSQLPPVYDSDDDSDYGNSDNFSDYSVSSTSLSPKRGSSIGTTSSRSLITPPPTPASSLTSHSSGNIPGFDWVCCNATPTLKLAGLLLLAGGFFTFCIGLAAGSVAVAVTGALFAGIGGLFAFFGASKKPELPVGINYDSTSTLSSSDSQPAF
jgi:hypothetical protein